MSSQTYSGMSPTVPLKKLRTSQKVPLQPKPQSIICKELLYVPPAHGSASVDFVPVTEYAQNAIQILSEYEQLERELRALRQQKKNAEVKMVDVASRELESKINLDLSEFKQEIFDADLKAIRSEIEMLSDRETQSLLQFDPPKWYMEGRSVPSDYVSKLQQLEQDLAVEEKKAAEALQASTEAPVREKSKEREALTRSDNRRSASPASNSNDRYTPKSRSPDRDYPREPYQRYDRENYRREWYPRDYRNYEPRDRNDRDYYEPPPYGGYRPRDKFSRGDERYRPYDNRDRYPRERREYYKDYNYKDYNNYKDYKDNNYSKDNYKDNYRDNSNYNKDYRDYPRDNYKDYDSKDYKDNYPRDNYDKDNAYKDNYNKDYNNKDSYNKDNYNKDNYKDNYPREPEKDYPPRDRPPYDRR